MPNNNWNPLKNRVALPNLTAASRKVSKAAKVSGNSIPLGSALSTHTVMNALPFTLNNGPNTIIPGFKSKALNELRSSRKSRRKSRKSRKSRKNRR
jgi:hypothetical protein